MAVDPGYWRGVRDLRTSALWLAGAVSMMAAAFGVVPDSGDGVVARFGVMVLAIVLYILGLRSHMRARRAMQTEGERFEVDAASYHSAHVQVKGVRILAWGAAGVFLVVLLHRIADWAYLLLPGPIALAAFGGGVALWAARKQA